MPEQTERLTLADAVAQMKPESIRVWLKAQPPERTFQCGNPTRCAISAYLSDITDLYVDADHESISAGWESVATPEWCAIFMRRFDRSRSGSSRDVKSTLRILRECCPELRRKHAN